MEQIIGVFVIEIKINSRGKMSFLLSQSLYNLLDSQDQTLVTSHFNTVPTNLSIILFCKESTFYRHLTLN